MHLRAELSVVVALQHGVVQLFQHDVVHPQFFFTEDAGQIINGFLLGFLYCGSSGLEGFGNGHQHGTAVGGALVALSIMCEAAEGDMFAREASVLMDMPSGCTSV